MNSLWTDYLYCQTSISLHTENIFKIQHCLKLVHSVLTVLYSNKWKARLQMWNWTWEWMSDVQFCFMCSLLQSAYVNTWKMLVYLYNLFRRTISWHWKTQPQIAMLLCNNLAKWSQTNTIQWFSISQLWQKNLEICTHACPELNISKKVQIFVM